MIPESSWTASEIAAEERSWLPSVNGSADVDPKDPDASRRAPWCCLHCRADVWTVDADGSFYCMSCGGAEFFNSGELAMFETATGTRMYVPHRTSSLSAHGEHPHGSDDHVSVGHSQPKSPAATRRRFPDVPIAL